MRKRTTVISAIMAMSLFGVSLFGVSLFGVSPQAFAQAPFFNGGHVYMSSPPVSPPAMAHAQPSPSQMQAFPAPASGMQQFVIQLPPQTDEHAFRLGLSVGQMQQTDGVNQVHLSGDLQEKTVQGWGYNYFEFTAGPTLSTLMAPHPGQPPVTRFVSSAETLIRYNSRLPVVIYAPNGFEVRYRIFSAGPMQSAQVSAQAVPPSTFPSPAPTQPPQDVPFDKGVELSVPAPVSLPAGSVATIRLYDSMLMDTNSTYAQTDIAIDQLPVTLPMPVPAAGVGRIVGPAVSVSVRDRAGRLLYWTDTSTRIASGPLTRVSLKSSR